MSEWIRIIDYCGLEQMSENFTYEELNRWNKYLETLPEKVRQLDRKYGYLQAAMKCDRGIIDVLRWEIDSLEKEIRELERKKNKLDKLCNK